MCTKIAKEVIDYYSSNCDSVCSTLLDATKAFYRVDYCKLFRLLLDRNIPSLYTSFLQNMFTNNVIRVAWNGLCSDSFV